MEVVPIEYYVVLTLSFVYFNKMFTSTYVRKYLYVCVERRDWERTR